ncbi:MAG: cytidine deaminase [Clostridia bacterium]|nr:cytidine deaminase [Clostridia bacterium]
MRTVLHDIEIKNLIRQADEAKYRAYVPYSHFRVGACLKSASGAYYLGANIENMSYGVTNCAERTALFRAVFEGERRFEALAVISDSPNYTLPCGACRQALSEFCDADMPVICANRSGGYEVFAFSELLPHAFSPRDMEID